MRFKITFDECPHCKDIPDGRMLEEHIQKYHDRLQANTKLGFTFLGITLLIAAVLILIAAAKWGMEIYSSSVDQASNPRPFWSRCIST